MRDDGGDQSKLATPCRKRLGRDVLVGSRVYSAFCRARDGGSAKSYELRVKCSHAKSQAAVAVCRDDVNFRIPD